MEPEFFTLCLFIALFASSLRIILVKNSENCSIYRISLTSLKFILIFLILLEVIGCNFNNEKIKNNLDPVHEIKNKDQIQSDFSINKRTYSIEQKMISGIIQDNFWDALKENKISPIMSIELSKIYAWGIDYFGLQKNDAYYIIYEERIIDSDAKEIERIHTAMFNHKNREFYAIYFMKKTCNSSNNEEKTDFNKPFLKTPLKYHRISSHFSKNRFHPILKINRPHSGIDYVAPEGTPVYSVGNGYILKTGFQKNGAGNYIKIKHDSVHVTQYAHLKSFAKGLKSGESVSQGQIIGYVGETGYATGPHLDFRIFRNDTAINPLTHNNPTEEIVKKLNQVEFDLLTDYYSALFPINNKNVSNNSTTFQSINGVGIVSLPDFFIYNINNQVFKKNQPAELLSSK